DDPAQAGLPHRLVGDLLHALQAHLADGGDAPGPRLDLRLFPDLEGALGGADRSVDVEVDAGLASAHQRRRARRLGRLGPAQPLDDLIDELIDLIRRERHSSWPSASGWSSEVVKSWSCEGLRPGSAFTTPQLQNSTTPNLHHFK